VSRSWSASRRYAALAVAFLAVSVAIFWPSLPGPFISDDVADIALNPYVQVASLAHVRAILDPLGDVALMAANWAPVYLLAHMLEWQVFGVNVAAYHLTNAVLHAVVSLLLVALLTASRVPATAAALAGAFFLVHPANVEAVAWMSQLKTVLAMAFMLGALLLRERRPALSTVAFFLALLCKALAAVALPMVLALDWARERGGEASVERERRARRATRWAWGVSFAAFAVVQFMAFLYQHPGGSAVAESPLEVRVWSSATIGMRYLVMASTGFGVSTFHEPAPVESPLDAWVLAGFAAGLVLAARLVTTLRSGRAEAAWWVLAAGSFAPVAQLFPFLYPMADRYLYFILPGLLGGALLAGHQAIAHLTPRARQLANRTLAAVMAATCVHFAVVSHGRASLWVSDARIMADAVRHYPAGSMAHYVRARGAARDRDAARAAAELRLAARNPAFGFQHVRTDPMLNPVRHSAEFTAVLRELAREQIEQSRDSERLTEADLIGLAQAQLEVENPAGAIESLKQALALQGGFREVAATLLAQARAMEQAETTAAGAGADGTAVPSGIPPEPPSR